jgi:hypothetical protein
MNKGKSATKTFWGKPLKELESARSLFLGVETREEKIEVELEGKTR